MIRNYNHREETVNTIKSCSRNSGRLSHIVDALHDHVLSRDTMKVSDAISECDVIWASCLPPTYLSIFLITYLPAYLPTHLHAYTYIPPRSNMPKWVVARIWWVGRWKGMLVGGYVEGWVGGCVWARGWMCGWVPTDRYAYLPTYVDISNFPRISLFLLLVNVQEWELPTCLVKCRPTYINVQERELPTCLVKCRPTYVNVQEWELPTCLVKCRPTYVNV